MPQQIQIPGVGTVEFPDSMSPDDINAAAKRLHDDANPSAAGGGDDFGTNALLAGGAAAAGVAALPLLANLTERAAYGPKLNKLVRSKAAKFATPLILAEAAQGLVTGRKSPKETALEAGELYAASKVPRLLQLAARQALPVVKPLGDWAMWGMKSAPEALGRGAGALAGAAEQGMSGAMGMVMSEEQVAQLKRQMLLRELQRSMKDGS